MSQELFVVKNEKIMVRCVRRTEPGALERGKDHLMQLESIHSPTTSWSMAILRTLQAIRTKSVSSKLVLVELVSLELVSLRTVSLEGSVHGTPQWAQLRDNENLVQNV